MESLLTMFITLEATSGVFTLFLLLYAFIKRSETPNAYLFMLYTGAQAVYIFGSAFGLASNTIGAVNLWTAIEYIGMAPAPALGLLLSMRYVGKSVTPGRTAAMFVIPAVTIALVATNGYHHLFYKSLTMRADLPVPMPVMEIGQWYVVHGVYTFGSMLAAAVLLMRRWRRTKRAYRVQLATLIVGQFIPMTAAFVYLMGVIPYGVDPVPMVLCVTSAMYIWAMVSTRLLTIVPIAKEHIFESMKEGVLVLDSVDRLIDFNGAAHRMLPRLSVPLIGMTLDEVWNRLDGEPFPIGSPRSDGAQREIVVRSNGEAAFYLARFSLVYDRGGERVGGLLMLIDVSEQRRLQDRLKRLAYYDDLTGLLNRGRFLHLCRKWLAPDAAVSPVAVILFDIDRFKSINDTYGHETGDRAIRHAVTIARRQLEPEMLFARFGGEEFVIALPSRPLAEAGELAERIRAALAAEPMTLPDGVLTVTSSFGAAASEAGETLETLLHRADTALYEAKRQGRNRVRLHEAEAISGTAQTRQPSG